MLRVLRKVTSPSTSSLGRDSGVEAVDELTPLSEG